MNCKSIKFPCVSRDPVARYLPSSENATVNIQSELYILKWDLVNKNENKAVLVIYIYIYNLNECQ